jgi:single-strand DNA-binding protein
MSTTITTEGNLIRDPDYRVTPAGKAVCDLALAVSSRRKNSDGEWVNTAAIFYKATCWNALAENVAESLRKGDRVLVHGASHDEEWTDRDGRTRSTHVLDVQAIGASLRYSTTRTTRPSKSNEAVTRGLIDERDAELADEAANPL